MFGYTRRLSMVGLRGVPSADIYIRVGFCPGLEHVVWLLGGIDLLHNRILITISDIIHSISKKCTRGFPPRKRERLSQTILFHLYPPLCWTQRSRKTPINMAKTMAVYLQVCQSKIYNECTPIRSNGHPNLERQEHHLSPPKSTGQAYNIRTSTITRGQKKTQSV